MIQLFENCKVSFKVKHKHQPSSYFFSFVVCVQSIFLHYILKFVIPPGVVLMPQPILLKLILKEEKPPVSYLLLGLQLLREIKKQWKSFPPGSE